MACLLDIFHKLVALDRQCMYGNVFHSLGVERIVPFSCVLEKVCHRWQHYCCGQSQHTSVLFYFSFSSLRDDISFKKSWLFLSFSPAVLPKAAQMLCYASLLPEPRASLYHSKVLHSSSKIFVCQVRICRARVSLWECWTCTNVTRFSKQHLPEPCWCTTTSEQDLASELSPECFPLWGLDFLIYFF